VALLYQKHKTHRSPQSHEKTAHSKVRFQREPLLTGANVGIEDERLEERQGCARRPNNSHNAHPSLKFLLAGFLDFVLAQ
jgi:hypothetical protein